MRSQRGCTLWRFFRRRLCELLAALVGLDAAKAGGADSGVVGGRTQLIATVRRKFTNENAADKIDKPDIKDIRNVFLSLLRAVRHAQMGLMGCANLAKTDLEKKGDQVDSQAGSAKVKRTSSNHQEGPRVTKSSPASASFEVVKDGVATSADDDVLDQYCSVWSERWRGSQRKCELSEDV